MPRGGPRNGKAGESYPNRTDLNSGPRIQAPTGQPYGQAGAQIAAQQALPMAPPPGPPPIALGAPTQRPGEPVQSGLSLGPGPGPNSIPALSAPSIDPDIATFAQYLPALELMTTLPDTSSAVRNLVRRLRGASSPEMIMPNG